MDLSGHVIAPTLYAYEGIPSVLARGQIAAVLENAKKDKTSAGLRDHAILQLLAAYGLRSGEIRHLRIEDIDWRTEAIHVRHYKTRATTFLPLLEPVGEAVLAYLRSGRPVTDAREIFIRTRAPYRKLDKLYSVVRRRLRDAGVQPPGKCGPHIFRDAHAVEMLRAAVPQRSSATSWDTVRQDRRLPTSSLLPRTSGLSRLTCRAWRCWHDRPLARSRPREHRPLCREP